MNYEFESSCKNWQGISPRALFAAQMNKSVTSQADKIRKTLEREVRGAGSLIIWTDCDREGENIGAEIRDICKRIKPSIEVKRAHFSEITNQGWDYFIAYFRDVRSIFNLVTKLSQEQ